MLTKQTTIDQITIVENGVVLYRECTKILEDGVELNCSYHRVSLTPRNDISGVPASVAQYCNLAWTPEIVEAYKVSQQKA